MSDDTVEIVTADGRFAIPATDLENYRVPGDPESSDEEVEGFLSMISPTIQTNSYLSLRIGTQPIVRTNSYVLFSAETMEGAPF